jgi:DNA-binding NarL/FixJ family response regulator
MIKVLLADDHSIVRAGLRRIIEESGDMTVVAEASDGQEAIREVHKAVPDVAVIDISMPGLDGLEFISRVRSTHPKLPILVLTMHEEDQYVIRVFASGANGYITKRSAPEQLVNAIRKVHTGGRYINGSAAEALALHMTRVFPVGLSWIPCPTGRFRCCSAWPWG